MQSGGGGSQEQDGQYFGAIVVIGGHTIRHSSIQCGPRGGHVLVAVGQQQPQNVPPVAAPCALLKATQIKTNTVNTIFISIIWYF